MLTFSLNSKSDEPMYHQIYSYIKNEIMMGRLEYREKLPSARELASNLSVSRNPVDTAYEQLVAEGYVYSMPKRGYFVNRITYTQQIKRVEERETEEEKGTIQEWKYDFNPDAVDVEHFPYTVWKSIGRRVLDDHELFLAGDYRGDLKLRRAVADYLHGSRGVMCSSANIVIGAGIGYLLQIISVIFQNDKRIAFEEPGYVRAKKILISNGFDVVNIGMKGTSIDVDALEQTDVDLCYVTPSHQFPLGTVMSIAERQRILQWAKEKEGRFIIEDDHDSEYRYKGKPIPALQSLDTEAKVIYIGTFSKSIGPALRMGYMVLPDQLMNIFNRVCGGYNCPVSRFDQAIVTGFINEGYFEKHLNRMRKKYKEKHDVVVNVLKNYEDRVRIRGDYAGLYVIAECIFMGEEKNMIKEAKKLGIYLRPLSVYYEQIPEDYIPSFLIGFARLELEELEIGLKMLCSRVFCS